MRPTLRSAAVVLLGAAACKKEEAPPAWVTMAAEPAAMP